MGSGFPNYVFGLGKKPPNEDILAIRDGAPLSMDHAIGQTYTRPDIFDLLDINPLRIRSQLVFYMQRSPMLEEL